jgi:hypothetical protein
LRGAPHGVHIHDNRARAIYRVTNFTENRKSHRLSEYALDGFCAKALARKHGMKRRFWSFRLRGRPKVNPSRCCFGKGRGFLSRAVINIKKPGSSVRG